MSDYDPDAPLEESMSHKRGVGHANSANKGKVKRRLRSGGGGIGHFRYKKNRKRLR